MERTASILVSLVGLLAVGYLAYRLEKERRARRRILAVLRDDADPLVTAVEGLMLSGQIAPAAARYGPNVK